MILCDREIEALLDDGSISIHPRPDKSLWTSTEIDLTLHKILLKCKAPQVRPTGQSDYPGSKSKDFNVQVMMEDPQYAERIEIDPSHGYPLHPRSFILGFTEQEIRFSHRSRIAARVEGKSSLARLGVGIHVTAPSIHAGFGARPATSTGAPIQLEIFNLGELIVVLDIGMPICQLILEEVREMPQIGYRGQFSEQKAFAASEAEEAPPEVK
jgi:dCTP deaminase